MYRRCLRKISLRQTGQRGILREHLLHMQAWPQGMTTTCSSSPADHGWCGARMQVCALCVEPTLMTTASTGQKRSVLGALTMVFHQAALPAQAHRGLQGGSRTWTGRLRQTLQLQPATMTPRPSTSNLLCTPMQPQGLSRQLPQLCLMRRSSSGFSTACRT